MEKVYRVYRVDYVTQMKTPVGTVKERRNRARAASNHFSLVKLARKIYGETPEDQMRIVLGEELLGEELLA
jgi:hypothetical protein